MQRRAFLQTTIQAASGTIPVTARASIPAQDNRLPRLSMYDKAMAASTELELLGLPRSWWHVHYGLHPFSPERTLIVPDLPQFTRLGYQPGKIGSLVQRIKDHLDDGEAHYTEQGICQVIYASSILTQTYQVPKQLDDWSRRMAWFLFRPLCCRWPNEPHWFCSASQGRGPMNTVNGVVDWWLILIPGGISIPGANEVKTRVLITPVFSNFGLPCHYEEFRRFMAKVLPFPAQLGPDNPSLDPAWLLESSIDRMSACLHLNQRIAQSLVKTQ
jgi:hypothetical protein